MSNLLKPIYVIVVISCNDKNFVVRVEKRSIYILFLFILKSVKNNVVLLYLRRHTKRILYYYVHTTYIQYKCLKKRILDIIICVIQLPSDWCLTIEGTYLTIGSVA